MRRSCVKGLLPVGAFALWLLGPVGFAQESVPEAPPTQAGWRALESAAADAPDKRPANATSGTHPETPKENPHGTDDPIHIISGSVEQYEADVQVECPLVNLTFHRVYHSAHESSGDLGPRWHHSYGWALEEVTITNAPDRRPWAIQLCVEPVVSKYVRIRALADPNLGPQGGDFHWFCETFNGYSTLDGDDRYRLAAQAGGGWALRIPGGLEYRFGAEGRLETIAHPAGQSITLSYTGGRLARAEHSNGQYLTFSHSNGRITAVATADPDLKVGYSYDSGGRLIRAVRHTPRGAFEMTYRYQHEARRLGGVHVWGGAVPTVRGGSDALLTERVNPNGAVFHYRYATASPVAARGAGLYVEPNLYAHRVEYPSTNRTRVIYRCGEKDKTLDYFYDPIKYKVTSISGRNSPRWTEQIEYAQGLYPSARQLNDDESGEYLRAEWSYDAFGNPTRAGFGYNSAPAAWTSYTWDHTWQVPLSIRDPEGVAVELAYTHALLSALTLRPDSNTAYHTQLTYSGSGLLQSVTNANGRHVAYQYNPAGYLTHIVPEAGPAVGIRRDALGRVTAVEMPWTNGVRVLEVEVDERGRLLGLDYPNGLSESWTRDAYGKVLRHVDTAGRLTTVCNLLGRPVAVRRTLKGTPDRTAEIALDYDQQLNMLRITDELDRPVETYVLDMQDRVVQVTNVETQRMDLGWGVGSYLNTMTRFDGSQVGFRYNGQGLLSQASYPNVTNHYAWRSNGLLAAAWNETGTVSNRYDAINRLILTVGAAPSGAVGYAYYPAGQVSNVTFVGGRVAYSNDAAERVGRITSPEGGFGYEYDPYNGFVAGSSNAAVRAEYRYDIVDRLTELEYRAAGGGVLFSARHAYDAAGLITQRQSVVAGTLATEVYAYDSLDRLIAETRLDATNGVLYRNSYGYDLAGNRTNATVDGVSATYTLGLGNRLSSWGQAGENACTYDAAGGVTQIALAGWPALALEWNGRYQLTSVGTNSVVLERYGFDALGRRAWTAAGGVTNFHVYDGAHVVADVDAAGALVKTYTWGPGIDNLLAFTVRTGANAGTYYALTDHLGSVHALTDQSGAVVESYRYDAWGRVLGVFDGSGQPLAQSALGNRYLWQGREYSWATGLYYFRARWYDPVTGRFLSKDPIGISGGLNQYVFCGNNPVNFTDPWGLLSIQDIKALPQDVKAVLRAAIADTVGDVQFRERSGTVYSSARGNGYRLWPKTGPLVSPPQSRNADGSSTYGWPNGRPGSPNRGPVDGWPSWGILMVWHYFEPYFEWHTHPDVYPDRPEPPTPGEGGSSPWVVISKERI